MSELKPWDQQPGESSKAFAAFNAYKNLAPSERSISRVSSDLVRSRSTIGGWSSTWNWVERAEEWDQEENKRLSLARIEAKKKMDEEHLKIVRSARNKAVQALKNFDPADLTPTELRAWLTTFMELERLVLGEPGTIVESREKFSVYEKSIEEEMREILPIIEDMHKKGELSDVWGEDDDDSSTRGIRD